LIQNKRIAGKLNYELEANTSHSLYYIIVEINRHQEAMLLTIMKGKEGCFMDSIIVHVQEATNLYDEPYCVFTILYTHSSDCVFSSIP